MQEKCNDKNLTAEQVAELSQSCQEFPFNPLLECSSELTKPIECTRALCVVAGSSCNATYAPVLRADGGASLANGTAIGVSYGTCGYLDATAGADKRLAVLNDIAGATFRVGLTNNGGGWTGVYSVDGKHFDGPIQKWSGPTLSFVQKGSLQGDFRMRLSKPPDFLKNMSLAYFGTQSSFDLCTYAVGAGFIDFCVGDYTISDARLFVADWVKLKTNFLYLAVPITVGDQSLADTILTMFRPFQIQTWLFIFLFVVPVLGFLFWLFDDGKTLMLMKQQPYKIKVDKDAVTAPPSENEEEQPEVRDDTSYYDCDDEQPKKPKEQAKQRGEKAKKVDEEAKEDETSYFEIHDIPAHERLGRSISHAYLATIQGSFKAEAVSTAAKLNLYAMAIFIFGFYVTYTANLTAQLTKAQFSVAVNVCLMISKRILFREV